MRDCLTALRLYASPVFLRENFFWIVGAIYAVLCFSMAIAAHAHLTQPEDARITFTLAISSWWLTLLSSFTAINAHYWRQTRSPMTFLMPRLRRAEYRAVLVVLLVAFFILSIPPLLLEARLLNTIALEALALALYSGADQVGPSQLRRKPRRVRLVATRILFLFVLAPRVQRLIFDAPWPAALALLLASSAVTLHELRFTDFRLDPAPPLSDTSSRFSDMAARFRGRSGFLMWRPPFLPRVPVKNLARFERPVTLIIGSVGLTLCFSLLSVAVPAITLFHMPPPGYFRHSLPQSARQVMMFAGIGLCFWMRERGDWPFLLTLTPFGSKHNFVREILRLHLGCALMAGAATGLTTAVMLWMDERMSLPLGLATGMADALLLVGCTCIPALAFLTPRLNRPSIIALLNIMCVLVVLQFAALTMSESMSPLRWLLPCCAVAAAGLVYLIVPRTLAGQDWPIEPPR
ncbi:hypothetical protein [Asaia krungthepensis]|uniref:Uncharacterized protein n=1 Tax=Asaia krungthepensis NRIC 0535 TaxID=1307925 RepID=A0ABQ0PYY0_9PROT|nr:hypothetical protein [Asaia krungthepensis]GBQ85056.1 hypothetical protein AA0535_0662 [Asaia krungthepensis NRIC 0535]